MTRFVSIFATLTLTFAFAGCANPDAIGVQQTGAVVGRVVDARTQQPVSTARVQVAGIAQAVDSGGAFNIIVPVGTQTITVFADGYVSNSATSVLVQQGQTSQAGLIALTPGGGP